MACDGNHKLIRVYLFNDCLVIFDDRIDKKKKVIFRQLFQQRLS